MPKSAMQRVTHYIWDIEGLDPVAIEAGDFWPGSFITTDADGHRWAMLDWDACPSWDIEGDYWRARRPDRELLACGHELPMRTTRNGKSWYVRPRRVCMFCARGLVAVDD